MKSKRRPPSAIEPAEYLLVSELAKDIGRTKRCVNYWISRGLVKASRAGPYFIIHKSEAERVRREYRHGNSVVA